MKTIAIALVVFALCQIGAMAQSTFTYTGFVMGSDGGPVVGATVVVIGTEIGAKVHADGRFTLSGLKDSSYTVRVTSFEYLPQTTQIRVNGDKSVQTITLTEPRELIEWGCYFGTPNRNLVQGTRDTYKGDELLMMPNSQR